MQKDGYMKTQKVHAVYLRVDYSTISQKGFAIILSWLKTFPECHPKTP